jgi:hypothetical protein
MRSLLGNFKDTCLVNKISSREGTEEGAKGKGERAKVRRETGDGRFFSFLKQKRKKIPLPEGGVRGGLKR